MKVIDLIQSMQAAIDQLSFHSADTEVLMIPRGYGELTGAIDVGEPAVDGKIIVSLGAKPIKFDFDLLDSKEGTKTFKTPASWGDIRDRVTTVGNVVTMNPPDCLTYGRPVVDDMINDALVHQQWMDICLRGGEDSDREARLYK